MTVYQTIAIILSLTVGLGYINHRFVRLPASIALMSAAMIFSIFLIFIQYFFGLGVAKFATQVVDGLDFQNLLLQGILGFLLFAGALTIDLASLKKLKYEIAVLSGVSTILSTVLVGLVVYYLLIWMHQPISLPLAFLFGAVISPTDPIAVLTTFKHIKLPKQITLCVAGESLFNDGIGIVLFTSLYGLVSVGGTFSFSHVLLLFCRQALGGILMGYVLGRLANWVIASLSDVLMVVLITLALVTGGYVLVIELGCSGPLAMVVAGILMGDGLKQSGLTAPAQRVLLSFWEIVDEVLNAILFLLIGFEVLLLDLHGFALLMGLLMIPVILLVRFVTVAMPLKYLLPKRQKSPWLVAILTWGGLRGGLAVALALSLPVVPGRLLLLTMTYCIVAFSVIVQGLTMRPLAVWASRATTG